MQIKLDTPVITVAIVAAVIIVALVLAFRINHARMKRKTLEVDLEFGRKREEK
jgi:hypothetical protein